MFSYDYTNYIVSASMGIDWINFTVYKDTGAVYEN